MYKRWVKWWIVSTLLLSFFLTVGVNVLVDPFGVFGTKLLPYEFQINQKIVKTNYLRKHHKAYDSYLFGSSRVGTIDPKVFEAYLPGTSFYNMTLTNANLYDYEKNLEYFIAHNYTIKHLFIQLDIQHMNVFGPYLHDALMRPDPEVAGLRWYSTYRDFLFGFYPFNVRKKLYQNYLGHSRTLRPEKSGMWQRPDKEERITQLGCEKFVASNRAFHQKNQRHIDAKDMNYTLKALQHIVRLCKTHDINLTLYTTPHNQHMMDMFILEDYNKFIDAVAAIAPVTVFSGYNSVTMNDCNYYEASHFRPHVAKWIAARLFHDESATVSDFGRLVDYTAPIKTKK